MRVLVVTTQLPYPPTSGGRMRTLSLLRRLAARHEITVMAYAQPDDPAIETLRQWGIACLPVAPPPWIAVRKVRVVLASLLGPLPYIMAKYDTPAMRAALAQAARSKRYDLLHCDSISLAHVAAKCGLRPALLAEHNVEALIWQRLVRLQRHPLRKAFVALQSAKLRRVEAQVCRAFDACVAVSQKDAQLLRRWYGVENVQVVPNGVDIGQPPAHQSLDGHLAFVGSMDWVPNQDAVRWMVGEVLPLVRRRHPRVTLSIIGRNPPAWMAKMSRDGLEVTGTVEDVRPYLERASVCVVPLRVGGGTRLKILEAMAAGKPVVSTSVGAEGLDLVPDRDIVLADSAQDFAEAVSALLADERRRRELALAGRQAAARYSWDLMASLLEHVWQAVADTAYKSSANCGK